MAFFQESRPPRQPFLNAPASVLCLIAVVILAHTARILAPEPVAGELLGRYALIPGRLSDAAMQAQGFIPESLFDKIVPFFSYIFLHGDFVHAGINSLWLLAFGPAVARRLGWLKFAIFFLFCGVIAGLAQTAVHWGSFVAVVGASGAVSGLMAAAIRILYAGRTAVFAARPQLAPLTSRPVLLFTVIWLAVSTVAGVLRLGVDGNLARIAWEAHIGGYLAGLLTIGLFDWLPLRRTGWRAG